MATQIFNSYSEFLSREDETVNGVSAEFAAKNAAWEAENKTNSGCYDCSGCSDCYRCYRCSGCSGCYGCYDCYRLKEVSKEGSLFVVPKIENIHNKVLESTSSPNALAMDTWHTCDTTHCRAGWVVVLAGEAGKELEGKTSTAFAAMQIYKASSEIKVSPVRFYETNTVAMADIIRCAEEENIKE